MSPDLVQAVAVTDGLVTAVGSAADAQDGRGPRTEVLDLGSATLLPGLTDPGHLRSVLAEAAHARRPDEWVLAWGPDPGGAPVHRAVTV